MRRFNRATSSARNGLADTIELELGSADRERLVDAAIDVGQA